MEDWGSSNLRRRYFLVDSGGNFYKGEYVDEHEQMQVFC